MPRAHRPFLLCAAALTFAWLAPGVARTQPGSMDPTAQAQAETLFSEGTALLEAGNVASACPKLEAAVELTRGEALGGKLMLGRCYERAGRFASAWGLFTEVSAKAAKAGQTSRASEASAAADAVSPRLHRVALVVAGSPGTTALSVVLGGRTLAPAAWSTPLPVDAGEIELIVSAQGKQPFRKQLHIPAEPGTTTVEVPELADADASQVVATPGPGPEREGSFWSGQRATGLLVGLFGVAGVGVGAGLGVVAIGAYDEGLVEGGCSGSPPVCDDVEPVNDARRLGDASTITLFSGIGLMAAGAILMLTAPNANVVETLPAPAVSIGPDHAFVSVSIAYD